MAFARRGGGFVASGGADKLLKVRAKECCHVVQSIDASYHECLWQWLQGSSSLHVGCTRPAQACCFPRQTPSARVPPSSSLQAWDITRVCSDAEAPPAFNSCLLPCQLPFVAIQVWDISGVSPDAETPAKLRVTAAVAAHDKDINAVAVAPNDSSACRAVHSVLLFLV